MNEINTKGVRFFDESMVYSFYCLIFFLPISTALVEIFTVLALLSYIIKRSLIFIFNLQNGRKRTIRDIFGVFLQSFCPPKNPLNQPVTIWLFVCLASVFLSKHPSLSFEGFLGKGLQNAFIFFNFVEAIRTRERLKRFLTVLFVSCTLVCLSGLNQYFFGMDFLRMHVFEHVRINSSFRAPNDFAAYLVIVVPILLGTFLFAGNDGFSFIKKKREKAGVVIVLLLALACLGLTYSRGGWLAFGVGLLVFSFGGLKTFLKLMAAGAVFVVFFTYRLVKERMYIDLTNLFGGFGRKVYWQEALLMIKEKPIFGFGLNTYSIIGRDYKISWGGYPHNCYLQMVAEMGIIGLISFFWIIFNLYKAVIMYLKQMDSQLKGLSVGTLAGFTGFLIHSAFDTFFYSVQLGSLMWVIMGLLISMAQIAQKESHL